MPIPVFIFFFLSWMQRILDSSVYAAETSPSVNNLRAGFNWVPFGSWKNWGICLMHF